MTRVVLAADFGGTHLRAAMVDEAGHVRDRRELDTPAEARPETIIAEVSGLLFQIAADSPEKPAGACLACAGLINADAGQVILSPNVPAFRNMVLTTPVAQRLGIPAYIENDASAAALGEFRFGAGRGTRHLLHATVGTGVGGGIVLDGRLYRGARGLAGEIGHVIMDPAGPLCNCGSRGCLEALVSGVAFAGRARRLLEQNRAPILRDVVGELAPTGVDLFAAAAAGERAAEAEIRNGGHILGLALGSFVNILNPDAVTLSGGLLVMGEMFLGPMREAMYSLPYGPASGTEVRLSQLDDDAGILGAAAVAFERLGL
jgi:glucokinase